MSDNELIWIEIGKVGDRVVEFSFGKRGKPPSSEPPLPRCDIGNCRAYLTNYQVLSSRVKYEGLVIWEPVPEEIPPTAPDRLRIARFISELPNQTFIADFKTLDQLYEWMTWKNNCIWIAKCFVAGHGSPNNPLLRPLEEGEIDQYYHDLLWLTVDYYENLWKLINLKTRRIKAAFNKQGWVWSFESPRQLLEEIIAGSIDGEFFNILKPRYENHAKELKRLMKLAHRSYKGFLDSEERIELAKLKEKHSQPNVWLKRLIDVSRLLGETDEFIRVRVAIHDEIMSGICKLQLDAACKPEWKQHGQISELWIDGVKRTGINNGWQA